MAEKPIYSTSSGDNRKAQKAPTGRYLQGSGPCKMRLETKGRGGKAVTVLFNLPFVDATAAAAVMKELQTAFGCGATIKASTIELRGDMRDRVEAYFATKGWRLTRAGG